MTPCPSTLCSDVFLEVLWSLHTWDDATPGFVAAVWCQLESRICTKVRRRGPVELSGRLALESRCGRFSVWKTLLKFFLEIEIFYATPEQMSKQVARSNPAKTLERMLWIMIAVTKHSRQALRMVLKRPCLRLAPSLRPAAIGLDFRG